jgi:ribosomal-protein-alanine N-acetyltransferase
MKLKADIITVSEEQAGEIAEIEKICIPGGWSEKSLAQAAKGENSIFLGAVYGGRIIGFINGSFVLDEAEIMNVAVLPEYRKQGIASGLIEDFCRSALEKQIKTIFLEVREKNLPAAALYEKEGFCRCGVRKNYYKDPCDNGVIMMKTLAQNGDIDK